MDVRVSESLKHIKIEYVDIDLLRKHPRNPRTIGKFAKNKLKESIMKFGIVDPLIVNMKQGREYTIIGGNMRYEIMRELGIKKVPCVFVYLDQKEEEELLLRLNRNTGDWDWEMLTTYFSFEDLAIAGFLHEEVNFSEQIKRISETVKRTKTANFYVRGSSLVIDQLKNIFTKRAISITTFISFLERLLQNEESTVEQTKRVIESIKKIIEREKVILEEANNENTNLQG